MALPPDSVLETLPRIGSDPETLLADTMVHLRLVDRGSGWKWYLLEWDGDAGFFGLILGASTAVAGQFGRVELEGLLRSDGTGLAWDKDFEPVTVRQLAQVEKAVTELLAEPAPRQVNSRGLVDLE